MNRRQFNISKIVKPFQLFLLLFVGAQLTVSCNGNKTKNEDHFKISIDLKAYKTRVIQIFYVINTDDSYSETLTQKKVVIENDSLQQLNFELPFGIKPKNLRIDVGDYEGDSVRIESIRLRYKNLELNGDHGIYKSWFTFNQNIVEGKDSLTFHFKNVNQIFDPQLNGNRKLNAKLVKLFPPDVNEKQDVKMQKNSQLVLYAK